MPRAVAPLLLSAVLCGGCSAVVVPSPAPTPTSAAASATSVPATPALTPVPTDTASDDPPAVLDVQCGPGAPTLGSDHLRASADGIHLRVTGEPGWAVGVGYELGRESVVLDAVAQELVLRIAPGAVTVDCADPTIADLPPSSDLTIDDPDGWYRSLAAGSTGGGCTSGSSDYVEGAKGAPGDPVLQARAALRGLQAGDVVERGGYPVDTGTVRIVRAGDVIGVLTFVKDGHGGWLLEGTTLCGGLGGG